MPQVKSKDRAALVAFLKARDITHENDEVPADSLKPTQAEYSQEKVDRFGEDGPRDRSVLVSSDGYVLDGHHQWMAAHQSGGDVNVIRFDAKIEPLLAAVREFPSVQSSDGAPDLAGLRAAAVADFKAALGDLAQIASKHTRAAMLPQNDPDLTRTLVNLFDAAIRIVGTDLKAATRWVKAQLKAKAETKKLWNKISDETYRKAALQALEAMDKPAQGGLFDDMEQADAAVQRGLFDAPAAPEAPKAAMIDGRPYDYKTDQFKIPASVDVLPADLVEQAKGYIKKFSQELTPVEISKEERARAEAILVPMLEAAQAQKVGYDQKIINIAQKVGALGQLIPPTLKKIERASVKLKDEGFDAGKMRDLLRSTIVVSSYADAQTVVDEIYREFEIVKGRVKNRTDQTIVAKDVVGDTGFLASGYGDVLVNVMFNGVQAEIQINVPEMLAAKDNEGHKLYEIEREQPEGSETRRAVELAQSDYYAAASRAAASRHEASLKTRGSDKGGQSLTGSRTPPIKENAPLPGITTASEPDSRSKNLQPGGNSPGTFITTPVDSNVPQITANGYTGGQKQGERDANDTTRQDGDEGKGPGAARSVDGGGDAQRVRPGTGGPDLGPVGDDDAGRPGAREVGRPGADGVRSNDADGAGAQPRKGDRASAGVPAGRDIAPKSGRNYAFGSNDLTYEGSWFKKAEQNVQAVELLRTLEKEGRQATAAEQSVLAQFVGWGSSEMANNLFGDKLDKQIEALGNYERAMEFIADNGGRPIQKFDRAAYSAFQVLNAKAAKDLPYYDTFPISKEQLTKAKPSSNAKRWAALRDRLRKSMSTSDMAEAARSTQYAHYTSKAVVSSMWKAMQRMGFAGGAILEPGVGIGVFPGLMPAEVGINSTYTGIEFDGVTGAIAKQLFPDERMLVESFVDSKLPKNFYDAAIGNPPFSPTPILADPEYAKQALALHDYFFAKTIDRVKPGGIVSFISSRYTMDKLDDKARKYLAERADLVGAIRLPQTAFKANAGTEVVTDVLFLRKKVPGETFEHAQPWLGVAQVKGADGKPLMVSDGDKGKKPAMINEYFAAHPEMVLGEHSTAGSMYSANEYTVAPREGDIEQHFAQAVENLPAGIYRASRGSSAEAAQVREIDFNPKAKKEGNYYLSDAGVLMVREGGLGQRAELKRNKNAELIKDFIPLRDALKQAHYDQLNNGDWEPSLKALQVAYKAFTDKHGQINQFTTRVSKTQAVDEDTGETFTDETVTRQFPLLRQLEDDPDYTLVAALETLNDDTGEIKPSAFLSQRVLGKAAEPAINSPSDALLTTLNDLGRVDIPTIAARLGMSEDQTIEALGTAVYNDPESGWQTADQYLSGNVKAKLQAARTAFESDRQYERNIQALEAAQPAPRTPSQISPSIGMNWIPGSDYARFLKETTGVVADILWNDKTRQWVIKEISGGKTTAATADWGTDSRNATHLMEHALTGRTIRVERTVDKSKKVLDAVATEAANQKLDALREEFSRWIWSDAERTDRLVQVYNDTFNTTVPRKFDGSHLTLPGTSKAFSIFPHVKRGAWRIIQQGNTYLAHAVGSGKTFQMVIAAMEQKRLGLIKKPMIVVPNHMLQQFASEWQQLYPAARLMVADENNFHTDNRRRFVSRVALSDLDGVIITHSAFKLLDIDPAFKEEMIEEQLAFLRASLAEADPSSGNPGKKTKSRDATVKQIERQVEAMENRLKKALENENRDKNARFDELGVDQIMVDEAHLFRKLDFATSRQVKGLSPSGSEQSLDLYMKTRYLEKKNPGRGLVMASGTVITNTLAELYTVQRFMGRQALIDKGIEDFDSWAAMFGRERTELEPDAAGKYQPVTRFSKFVNVPELTQMFREFADVLTADQLAALLGDKRPKVAGGSRTITVAPKTDDYKLYQAILDERVKESRAWKPSKDQPNNPDPMIAIIGDGRLAAIDTRFVFPDQESNPESKLNVMIDEVIKDLKASEAIEYNDKSGKAEPNKGATMMVFSDIGFGKGVAEHRGFNARAWFEKRLRDAGIPASQVAFMQDYKQSAKKLKLFRDVNAGRVRLLVGSSKNMGTGVNAQQRLLYEHHLDSPWFPADLEQREGRIIRTGNKNKEVYIKAWATKGTYDENMWKMLATKQFFIDQAMSGDENLREIEDLDNMSQYDLAAAMVAEDQRVLQLAGAKAEIDKLNRLYQAHEDQRSRFRRDYRGAQASVEYNEKALPKIEKLAAQVQDLSGDNFTAKVGGKAFAERAKWAEALVEKFKDLEAHSEGKAQVLGQISGFDITYSAVTVGEQFVARMGLEAGGDSLELFGTGYSEPNMPALAMRAQNFVASLAKRPARVRALISEARNQMDALLPRLDTPFPMAGMLADKIKEAADLAAAIEADGKEKAEDPAEQAPDAEAVATLSRGPGGAGMAVKDLSAVVDKIAERLPRLPKVHVLTDASKAPKALRAYIDQQGAAGDVEAALHDGEIYMFAAGMSDPLRVEHVLAEHEAAHFGLRAILGDKLQPTLMSIYNQNASVRKAATKLQARGLLTNVEAAEEVIVDIPTKDLARLKGWRSLVGAVRDALASLGFERMAAKLTGWLEGSMSDQARADLFVGALVRSARQFVAGKGAAPKVAGTALSGKLSDDLAAQEKWLLAEARARGYKDIEDLLEKDYPLLEKLALKWREKHPADALLSRAQIKASAAERAEKIINTKAAHKAPIDFLAKTLTRVTGVDRLAGAIYNRAGYLLDRYTPETVKAGVISDYGVPQAVIDQRTLLQGRQRVQLRKAGELVDKLATLTRAESRVAYEWMNMDGSDPKAYVSMMQGLPEESVQVLQDVQKMIDQLSKEAVRLGQLSQDAFERNRWAYLRRSYAKHILEQTAGEKAKRARVISILGDQYKGRGLTEAASMDKIKNSAPEWWGRKLKEGKGDAGLKGQQFLRLERRDGNGAGVAPLDGMDGKGTGRLREVAYWPAGYKIPPKYSEWTQAGTFEVRDVKGQNLILWRDFTKDEREAMGEVDEARFAIAKTMHAMIHDVEVGRYLEWMAHNQAKKDGEAIPGNVVEASERYKDTFKPGEWVRVPDTKISGTGVYKYGKLAGRYLPGPVWNDLRQTVGGKFKPFGDTYAKILTLWKTSKTALSPAVHMNNIMSNFVMADFHDVGAAHVAKALRIILGASQRDGTGVLGSVGNAASRGGIADAAAAREIMARYSDSGADIGSWVTNEIARDQLEPLLASLDKELAATAGESVQAQTGVYAALQHAMMLRFPSAFEALKPTRGAKAIANEASTLIDLYQSEDDVFRLAAWLKAKEDGESDLEAGRRARRSFLDYNINAPWIQAMRQSLWPFISFTYRAVPMLIETAGKKPHKLMKLMLLAGGLNALGAMLAGGDDDDERKLLPEEKAGKIWGLVPKLIRMPWNDQFGSPVYLDIRRFIPVGDVFDVGQGQSAIPILPGMQPGGPAVVIAEVLSNRSWFTGKDLVQDTDTAGQAATKVVDHLYKAMAPNILGLPGTYATTGVIGSMTGRTDAFGREMSTTQAIASSFGVKLGSYPADVLRRNLTAKTRYELSEIQRNISQLKRQRQLNRIDQDEFMEKVQVEQEKKADILKKLSEKMQ
jgi:N12 class adenine-specific DNA methylase/adenine-specific DNA methylase